MNYLTKLSLSAALATGLAMPAAAETELTMYYPIAVGGKLTEVVDDIVAQFEAANPDINVNAVCPGVTRTALSDANLRARAEQEGLTVEAMEARRAAMIPLGRANDARDIADMVVFLASPGARNITGQTYNVDGGIIPE